MPDTEQQSNASKTARLNELKIDRNAPTQSSTSWVKWLAAAALTSLGLVLWLMDTSGASPPIPVKTSLAMASSPEAAASSVLDATGYVVARRQATVSSKATGKVIEVLIEEGLQVSEGQLLARLDDSIPRAQYELAASQLDSAHAGLRELEVALKQAKLDLDRTKNLANRNLASQADLDRDGLDVEGISARLARANKDIVVAERAMAVQEQLLSDMQIRAPFAGIVIAKAAQPGEMISPVSAGGGFTRTGICTIVDMDSLEIEVDVNESYINRVYQAQPAQVTLNAYPDYHFPAEVIAIIPAADRNKATVRVRVGFLERDARVLPDMGVRVAFLDETQDTEPTTAPQGVLIPRQAIGQDAEGTFVYVVQNTQANLRRVRVATNEGSRTRVLTGLANGERVINGLNETLLAQLYDGVTISTE